EHPRLSNNADLTYSSGPTTNIFTGVFPFFFLENIPPLGPLSLGVPPTPRSFVTQDIGVSLEVKPTTYPDQRIDLDITKAQVVDFDGFVNYGVPIVSRLAEDIPPP